MQNTKKALTSNIKSCEGDTGNNTDNTAVGIEGNEQAGGIRRTLRRKSIMDSYLDVPPQPKSPFVHFVNEYRTQVAAANTEATVEDFGSLNIRLVEVWKGMSDDQKKKYNLLFEAENEQYNSLIAFHRRNVRLEQQYTSNVRRSSIRRGTADTNVIPERNTCVSVVANPTVVSYNSTRRVSSRRSGHSSVYCRYRPYVRRTVSSPTITTDSVPPENTISPVVNSPTFSIHSGDFDDPFTLSDDEDIPPSGVERANLTASRILLSSSSSSSSSGVEAHSHQYSDISSDHGPSRFLKLHDYMSTSGEDD